MDVRREGGTWCLGIGIGAALAGLLAVSTPAAAGAGQPEAREAARNANCAPGKVTVLRQRTGLNSETVFKVDCTDAKGQFVVVQCRNGQCTVWHTPATSRVKE